MLDYRGWLLITWGNMTSTMGWSRLLLTKQLGWGTRVPIFRSPNIPCTKCKLVFWCTRNMASCIQRNFFMRDELLWHLLQVSGPPSGSVKCLTETYTTLVTGIPSSCLDQLGKETLVLPHTAYGWEVYGYY